MIKLQLLLRHPAPEPALDAAVRARLEQLGFIIDGCGRATVTAHMNESSFRHLFGTELPAPPAAPASGTPDLAVPATLSDDISLITCAPRHAMTNQHPRGPHASI